MSKFLKLVRTFPRTFWVANSMELFERWAWYGMFNVLALYLTKSTDEGALGFSQVQKGHMMGVVTAVLYFLPVVTGALADRVGYKKMLIIAYFILGSGYYFMGVFTSYTAVFLVFLYISTGAAIFKPIISASVTKTTNKENSSLGFGLFYMIINVGGFFGPFFSSKLRAVYGWKIIFIMALSAIMVNLLLVIFLYKEPKHIKRDKKLNILKTIKETLLNISYALRDFRLVIFLVIMVGFWTLFNQLFYTLPNFIDQWMDTRILFDKIASISPALACVLGNSEGIIPPEMIINLDSFFIIIFQLYISSFISKVKPIHSIIAGLLILTLGLSISFSFNNPMYTMIAVFIFSIGEMTGSPKFTEYIGRIALEKKEALYMGTSFLPVAVGNWLAGILSGSVYQYTSDKITLLRSYMESKNYDLPEISATYTQNDFFVESTNILNLTNNELTQILWDSYNPAKIWYIFAFIGIGTTIALLIYNKIILGNLSNTKAQA